MANVGGVFAVLISGAGVGIIVSIFESVLDVRNRASELEVRLKFTQPTTFSLVQNFQIPFLEELIREIKFIAQCTGNTKIVMHKKSTSHEASAEHESRSISRSSSKRELTTNADSYGFRPSLKNLEKLDLMPDHEVAEIEDV